MSGTFPRTLGFALLEQWNTLSLINGWLTRPMKSRKSANDWCTLIRVSISWSARCGINKAVAVIGALPAGYFIIGVYPRFSSQV